MTVAQVLTGEEFLKALTNDALSEPIVLVGMAKLEDPDKSSFMSSVGTSCASWFRVQLELVENVEFIQIVTCKDHSHPLIRLRLKQPSADNPLSSIFIQLVRATSKQTEKKPVDGGQKRSRALRDACIGGDPGCPDHAPCHEIIDGISYCTDCCIAVSTPRARPVLTRQSRRKGGRQSNFNQCNASGKCRCDGESFTVNGSGFDCGEAHNDAYLRCYDNCNEEPDYDARSCFC